jgi:hypothetical protein
MRFFKLRFDHQDNRSCSSAGAEFEKCPVINMADATRIVTDEIAQLDDITMSLLMRL